MDTNHFLDSFCTDFFLHIFKIDQLELNARGCVFFLFFFNFVLECLYPSLSQTVLESGMKDIYNISNRINYNQLIKISSQPRDWTPVSHIAGRFVTIWATRDAHNTGVGSLSLLQGIFQTQELNQGLLHCRRILYQLSYQGSPTSFILIRSFHTFCNVSLITRKKKLLKNVKYD